MSEFLMPSLGGESDTAILTAWLVGPGDEVKRGDLVATVETTKGLIDIEIFENGRIEKLLAEPGTEVTVGTPIALIAGAEEETAPGAPISKPEPTPRHEPESSPPAAAARPPISPAARRCAREFGIDPNTVTGTGAGGAVTSEDIRHAAQSAGDSKSRPAAMRQAIAAAMARSKREIPHYYLCETLDFQAAADWLTEENLRRPVTERLLPAALFVKAVAVALTDYPELNGTWEDGDFQPAEDINPGMAIALRGGGLVAPALFGAARKDLGSVMSQLRELVERARTGRLRQSEMTEATITVTSLGEHGVEAVLPVIYPPQVAIVGFGAIQRRPWIHEGQVAPRTVVTASLAADHRASDGHRGARFLSRLRQLLQEPEKL